MYKNTRGDIVKFTAIIHEDEGLFVSWCPELDIASQGKTIETALENLKEAIELYLEDEDAKVSEKMPFFTFVEVAHEKAARPFST
jgi:predicted RNase H-like HicB family nuclease